MADFKTILGELALGSTDLDSVRKWTDEAIEQGEDRNDLLAQLDEAAEQLPEETANALRAHLSPESGDADDGMEFDFNIDIPTPEDDDRTEADPAMTHFDGELSLEGNEPDDTVAASGDEPTAADTPAEEADPDKTVFEPPQGKQDDDLSLEDDTTSDHTEIISRDESGSDRTEVVPRESAEDATDRTQLMDQPQDDGDGDRTVVEPRRSSADPDATVLGDSDPTVRGAEKSSGDEYDPFAMGGGGATRPGSASTPTGTGWPTSTAWPGQSGGHDPDSIGPGTILKERFELLSAIGEGGMGTVYKARDLLKVEAKDRNPYIAVKLLSGDFREHPEAFIALQRESSKAQKLAHPNIATVYDFDRDGGTVYMTMELLEGEELARFIKKLPPGGLPADEALGIIKQLCDGLEYAHARGLVHSDFKPGNCFYLSDGTVKILDFGIARASKTRSDVQGETTVFDPGQLGALTPAYATPEMFEGINPDARDDIYALAAVSWELLQGKHPFNKLSSVKAMEKGLTPQVFTKPGFTKRQARALIKALSFKREDRTASIQEFWDGIRFKKNKMPMYITAGIVSLSVLGALSYRPIVDAIEENRNAEIITQLERGSTTVPEVLAQLDQFSERARRNLLEDAKDSIIAYYEQQAEARVNASAGRYDYPAAQEIVREAEQYYPDSAQLQRIETDLADARAALIARLTAEFDQYLEQDRLMPLPEEEDITDILNRMQQADPDNALLSDARLTQRYADLAQAAIRAGDWQRAQEILDVSLAYSPDDASLLNLADQVGRELQRQADAKRVAELKQSLDEAQASLESLDDFAAIVDELNELANLRPDDARLATLQSELRAKVRDSFQANITAGNWSTAEDTLLSFASMFPVNELMDMRASLSRAEIEAGYQPAQLSDKLAALEERRSNLQALLEQGSFDAGWNNSMLKYFKEAVALLRPGNTWFEDMQERIVDAYIEHAAELGNADRFDAARRTLATAEQFDPGLPRFAEQREALAAAETQFAREQQEKIRLARIAAQKNTLRVQAEANDVASASRTFEALKSELPGDDAFITTEAPALLASAYERLANTQGERGNYSNAAQFARKGLEIAPDHEGLKDALSRYSNLAEREQLMEFAANATPGNIRELPERIQRVRALFPEDATAISNEAIRTLADHIKQLENSDVTAANELWQAAKNLYPGNRLLEGLSLRTPPKPSAYVPSGRQAMTRNELSRAEEILATARREEPGNQQVAQFAKDLEERKNQANQYFVSYQQLMRQGQKSQAKLYLDQALRLWVDNEQFKKELASNFTTTTAPTRSADGSRPCSANLAGYGRSGRAVCFDMLPGNTRGPELVVVPAGGSFSTPYAIGKYEVSVNEFNAYCAASGKCPQKGGNGDLPVTGIPLAQMEGYVEWLSNSTGKDYRIPTAAEWEYAANANNPGAVKDFNCRVTQGGQVLKGLALLEVKSGRPNPWGVTNYVGNVQEVVRNGNSTAARGGAFEDNLSACDIKLSRSWSGNPSDVTGLRVVRNID